MLPEWLYQDRATLEEHARRTCMTVNLGQGRLACRVLGKYLMFVEPEDCGITPHLALNGCWEPWITLAIARLARPGWRCIDVGANVGYYALLLADAVGKDGRVLALEPNPTIAQWLELNAEVNGFSSWLEIHRCAVGCANHASANLFVDRSHPGNATVVKSHSGAAEGITVPCASIDELVANWPRVDLVKIDAEGAEPEIWQGMRETLSRYRELIVFMEFTPSTYQNPVKFLADIEEAGFSVRHVIHDGAMMPLRPKDVDVQLASGEWTMLFLVRD